MGSLATGDHSSTVNKCLRRSPHRRLQGTTKRSREWVLELQYADQCAPVARSQLDLHAILAVVVRAYSMMGLSVNTAKTDAVCQWSATAPHTLPVFTKQLKVLPSLTYLGGIVSEDCNIDQEIQNQIKQASAAFGRLWHQVVQNKDLHPQVYQTVCITVLLYSCEAWVTTAITSFPESSTTFCVCRDRKSVV